MPRNLKEILIAVIGALTIILVGLGVAFADESDDHPAVFFAKYGPRTHRQSLNVEPSGNSGLFVKASWYGGGERLNRHTASGERFNPRALTAAHRTLPLGTRLQVCLSACIVVRINDRGPARWTGRDLDLSRAAAIALGFHRAGEARVRMAVM